MCDSSATRLAVSVEETISSGVPNQLRLTERITAALGVSTGGVAVATGCLSVGSEIDQPLIGDFNSTTTCHQ